MSKALQSAQQSLSQAGQQQQAKAGQNESSESEMGQEMGQGKQGQSGQQGQQGQGGQQGKGGQAGSQGQGQGKGQQNGGQGQTKGSGGGMGKPGRGIGGNAGAQQPLPGQKKEVLIPGTPDSHGKQLSRSYMGTPDPTKDRQAYYSIVPEKVKAAEASLNKEDIPTPVKKPVQKYFDSIQNQ